MSLTVDNTEEKISELTDVTTETIQFEAKRKKMEGEKGGTTAMTGGSRHIFKRTEKLVGEGHRKREADRKNN